MDLPYEVKSIKSYEIIDGCPAAGDNIYFRFPLRGVMNLTPTLKNIFNKFSVRYYLKLMVLTEEKEEILVK
jgi:vacuolar protein sorting-associated protein 26